MPHREHRYFGSTAHGGDDAVVVVQPIEVEAGCLLGRVTMGIVLSYLQTKPCGNCLHDRCAPGDSGSPAHVLTRREFINTFHWHVVDSQSFPLVVPGFTDIAEKAAYSADAVCTPQDVAHVVSYAGLRGIDVPVVRGIPRTKGTVNVHNRKWTLPDIPRPSRGKRIRSTSRAPMQSPGLRTPTNRPRANCTSPLPRRSIHGQSAECRCELFPSTLFATGGNEINTRAIKITRRRSKISLDGRSTKPWTRLRRPRMVWISSDDAATVAAKDSAYPRSN
ncbi:hypothetical protein BGW80DRAFT_1448629 [Lactifluus volemus]|nr:hypothetical protein BGW80DRAFT_1448629 [Lactifluus volemus]